MLYDNIATLEEECVDDPVEIVAESQALDMVIKSDFAKYMIDQKASMVPANSPVDKTTCISAPAFSTKIHNLKPSLVSRVLVRAMLERTTKPFINLKIELVKPQQNNTNFIILFEESLLKYLPQDPSFYQGIYASFASTSMDKFLFIQFPSINFQIRTLLLSRDQDLKRIFTEKSFFAVANSTCTMWKKNFSLDIEQMWEARLLKSPMGLSNNNRCVITIRDTNRNQFYEKDNYSQLFLELQDPSEVTRCYLYSHATCVEKVLPMFVASTSTPVVCTRNAAGYILHATGGEKLNIIEIQDITALPVNILRGGNFIIKQNIQQSFNNNEFFITNQKILGPVNKAPVLKVELYCPFPSCSFKEFVDSRQGTSHELVLDHFFDKHEDFSKVILGQLQRHQEKSCAASTNCPFRNCDFTSMDPTVVQRHYGIVHTIGQIVFLQFSLVNKWSIETFKQIGFITTLVQCSHCFEVMTREQLASHVASLK